jgi:hypothetical protein
LPTPIVQPESFRRTHSTNAGSLRLRFDRS